MKIYVDSKPENCNHCIFTQSMGRHWDLEDYCLLNKKNRSKIIMDMDCPLKEMRGKYIFSSCYRQNRERLFMRKK